MAWTEDISKRTFESKTYQDGDKFRREQIGKTLLHYPLILDDETLDGEVDFAPIRVDNPQFDGWRITQAGWHYALGKDLANHGNEDGWVGFGGRQGQHWFKFRLLRVGYLHWPTRAWEDIGGSPTYNRARLSHSIDTISIGPNSDVLIVGSWADWKRIWSTPGGGQLDISWSTEGYELKEEIYINEVARNWITSDSPPSTPANETYFGFVFDLDVSDIPKCVKRGILQDLDTDFDDDDGSSIIELRDAEDKLLNFLPINIAESDPYLDSDTLTIDTIPLRKRFWRENGNNYLLVGAKASELNQLHDGGITFDPTNTYQKADSDMIDTTFLEASPTNNYDLNKSLWTNRVSNQDRVSVLLFDISDITSDNTCDSCTMTIYVQPKDQGGKSSTEVTRIYPILSANDGWTEAATWNTMNGSDNWAGGNTGCNDTDDYNDANELGYNTDTVISTDYHPWLPAPFILSSSDIQDWFGTNNDNYGILMRTYDLNNHKVSWGSASATDVATRPKLSVEYSGIVVSEENIPVFMRHYATLRGE